MFQKIKNVFSSSMTIAWIGFMPLSAIAQSSTDSQKTEPTSSQARDFITSMIEQHGRANCLVREKDWDNRYEDSQLVSLDGNRLIIQQTSVNTTVFKKGMNSIETSRSVSSQLMSETDIMISGPEKPLTSECTYPVTIKLKCKTGMCVTMTFSHAESNDGVSIYGGAPITDRKSQFGQASGISTIYINDDAIALRLQKAFEFYKAHAPSAANSPF